MGVHENLTGAQRAARRRAKLRAQGLRPIQLWVPDLRNPKVLAELEREVASINRAMASADELAFVDAAFAATEAMLPPYDWGAAGPPSKP
jgi:Protein  of unknown function (DUF3018)